MVIFNEQNTPVALVWLICLNYILRFICYLFCRRIMWILQSKERKKGFECCWKVVSFWEINYTIMRGPSDITEKVFCIITFIWNFATFKKRKSLKRKICVVKVNNVERWWFGGWIFANDSIMAWTQKNHYINVTDNFLKKFQSEKLPTEYSI